MRNFKKILFSTLGLILLITSCQEFETDLEVENLENPNDAILASDPVALEATAGNILNSWYMTVHSTSGPGAALQTMADVTTCSWGNFGMRDLSSEPRVAFNNTTGYSNNVTSSYFNSLYSLLTDSNTLVTAVEGGTEFSEPEMILMMGKMGQALSVGYLALVFDRVWLYDADGPIGDNETGETDYATAMSYALDRLDEAISLAEGNTFILPETWLPGVNASSSTIAEILNSFGARMLVCNVRNSSEKTNINWDRVLAYTNDGITADFNITMDDITWYDLIPKTYLVYPGWGKVDMRIVNLLDPNMPSYWTNDLTNLPEATSADARLETDYEYTSSNSFSPDRGLYHFSNYRYSRLDDYITEWTIPVTELSKSELDMYKAEALLNKNDLSGAASVINAGTRTTRGNLPDVEENTTEIFDAIFYERMIEFAYTGMGLSFFEMRKEELLQEGTLLHFPVPGTSLDAIPEEYYTYGGTSGEPGKDYSTGGWR